MERCICCGKWFKEGQLTDHHLFFPKKQMRSNVIVRICRTCHNEFNRYVDRCGHHCEADCGKWQYMCGYSGWFGPIPYRGSRLKKSKRAKRKGRRR